MTILFQLKYKSKPKKINCFFKITLKDVPRYVKNLFFKMEHIIKLAVEAGYVSATDLNLKTHVHKVLTEISQQSVVTVT